MKFQEITVMFTILVQYSPKIQLRKREEVYIKEKQNLFTHNWSNMFLAGGVWPVNVFECIIRNQNVPTDTLRSAALRGEGCLSESHRDFVFSVCDFCRTLPQSIASLLFPLRITAGISDNYAKMVNPEKWIKMRSKIPACTNTARYGPTRAASKEPRKTRSGPSMHV